MTDANTSDRGPVTSNKNTGHGHVYPRPDGVKARCGGPSLCSECARDYARYAREKDAEANAPAETNRDKAIRGEPVQLTDGRLLELQKYAIDRERYNYGAYLHWHWAAAINELIELRKRGHETSASQVQREALQQWRDACSCGCDACVELIETLGLESASGD